MPSTLSPRLVLQGLALAGLVALSVSACRGTPSPRDEGRLPFREVRPPVAFEMMRDNEHLPVIDLRPRREFIGPTGHVRGARNVPLEEVPERLLELSGLKDRTFLIYCGHGDCGERALELFLEAGFDDVILMDGGIDLWILAGFATVQGPAPPVEFDTAPVDEEVVE